MAAFRSKRHWLVISSLAASFVLFGCKKNAGGPDDEDGPPDEDGVSMPDGLFLSSPPADAKGVGEIKSKAKPGQKVVIRGRIGGSKDPFVKGQALMTIVDPKLVSCADNMPDKCDTPWDYCCEPKDSLAANMATIQYSDVKGNPLKSGFRGKHGIAALKTVVISGKVHKDSTKDNLIVVAEGLFVEPK